MGTKSGTVAILGQANVGKSTLLNRFIGEPVAIVTPRAQTTRNRIVGILNRPGAQVVFVDTPGYHSIPRLLNQFMLAEIERTIDESDLFCVLIDPRSDSPELDNELMERLHDKSPVVVVNKADLMMPAGRDAMALRLRDNWNLKELFFVSALRGEGMEALVDLFVKRMPEGEPLFPDDLYTEMPLRFLAAEAVREQAITLLFQEIPYGIAVEILSFEEKPRITVIRANIVVEKASHKGIVIGKGGQTIKKIGTCAREKVEFMMGEKGKVFLELFVKVDPGWTHSAERLKQYGYGY